MASALWQARFGEQSDVLRVTLTPGQPRQTMQRMVRWSRVLASLLVVIGLLSYAWATCTASAAMPEQAQMACCKAAGHHDCGRKGAPADCCKASVSADSQWTVAKANPLSAPFRPFLALLIANDSWSQGALVVVRTPWTTASPPTARLGPPLYIAFSTLLI